jgi:hypothetical protein
MNEGSDNPPDGDNPPDLPIPAIEEETASVKSYRSSLIRCFNLAKGTSHPRTYRPTEEELFTLTPEHIYAFLATKAYGVPNPSPTAHPTNGRSASLEFAKKAISYFMPNRLMVWNQQTRVGNPTRSNIVNELIKRVKKQEVRRQGRTSQARRPLEEAEFRELIRRVHASGPAHTQRYSAAAFYIFQFHLIGRLDDVAKFKLRDLTPCIDYPFCLQSKMCWSKNVLEERDAPNQIIIGAMDPFFCTLLSLGIYLEGALRNGMVDLDGGFLFSIGKTKAASTFRNVLAEEGFPLVNNQAIGTHSNRKFPSTYARRNGCSRDDVDARGRWKRDRRIVDSYIDVRLPYPDAKVASVLAIGGPVKYEIRNGCDISDEWVVTNVTPFILQQCPRQVAVVLGKAVLWGVFDNEVSEYMDAQMVQSVRTALLQVPNNGVVADDGTEINPIRKRVIDISGSDGNLVITELGDNENENEGGGGGGQGARPVGAEAEVRALTATVNALRRENIELKNELILFKNSTNSLLKCLNTSVKRIAQVPALRAARVRSQRNNAGGEVREEEENATMTTTTTDTATPYIYTLTKCPGNLYVLWQEWEFGVGGRRPAKSFNGSQRGKVKFNYCLRKPFWNLVTKMIRSGYCSASAIEKIYNVYSTRLSTTKILRKIRQDARQGGHAQLRF